MRKKVLTFDHATGTVVETEHEPVHGGGNNWPLKCEALAVGPNQIQEQMEVDRRCGVPTEYDKIGRPIITGPIHYRRYKRLNQAFDRNGFDR